MMRKLVCKLMCKLGFAVAVGFLVWVLVSIVDIDVHNGNPNHEYSKANFVVLMCNIAPKAQIKEEVCLVVDCTQYANGYEVCVRDLNGNEWAYMDSNYVCPNELIEVFFDGENRIVDVKEGE